jgi:hypothetical protein
MDKCESSLSQYVRITVLYLNITRYTKPLYFCGVKVCANVGKYLNRTAHDVIFILTIIFKGFTRPIPFP